MANSDNESIISSIYWQSLAAEFDQSHPSNSEPILPDPHSSQVSNQSSPIGGNSTPPSNQLQAQASIRISRKRRLRDLSPWVWGSTDNPNGKVVIYDGMEYWQCTQCPQRYRRIHGTTHCGEHLNKVHNIFESYSTKTKRLYQAQNMIERALKNAEEVKI